MNGNIMKKSNNMKLKYKILLKYAKLVYKLKGLFIKDKSKINIFGLPYTTFVASVTLLDAFDDINRNFK